MPKKTLISNNHFIGTKKTQPLHVAKRQRLSKEKDDKTYMASDFGGPFESFLSEVPKPKS